MVLCKFYQQGNCRFGSKCNNEHIDMKQLIKTDVEAAINGKQWPLSCYGPFKDKPCLPNFADDQSFEEVRYLCYDAKQKNFLNTFLQQFTRQVMEANQKMTSLQQVVPLDMVCRLYDAPADNSVAAAAGSGAAAVVKSNNPFGFVATASTEASSIFGKPATAAAPTSSNIFGTGSFSSTTTGNSLFSGGVTPFGTQQHQQQQQQPQQTSIFGQAAKPANSIFGGGSATQGTSPSSIFGQTQSTAVGGGGLFGQAAQQTSTPIGSGGGLFAQAAAAQQQQQQSQSTAGSGFGLFAQAAKQTTPIFGQQNPFVQATQPQQQQQQPGTNIFGQAAQQQHQQATTGLFAQTAPAGNIFAQAATLQSGGGDNLFRSAAPVSDTQTQNIFAQAVQQQPMQQQQQQQMMQQPQQQTAAGGNIFAQAMQQTAQAGLFQQRAPEPQRTAFPQQPVSGGNNVGQPLLQSPVISSSVYSKMEDLTPEEIEAFKADTFTPGKVPIKPPPRELIN